MLVGVGLRRRVRIETGRPGIGAREQRPGGARHREADARLQDAVALGDAAERGIDPRAVQRVRDDADQRARGVAREPGVRIEREAVANRRQQVQAPDLDGEARIGRAAQQTVEFFDLAALALPADPRLLALVPLAAAGEEEETVSVLGLVTAGSLPPAPPPRPSATPARIALTPRP